MDNRDLGKFTWASQKSFLIMAGIFLISLFLVFSVKYFTTTPFLIALIFLILIFLPGFSLAKIFRINFSNDCLGQIILYLTLGFIYNLILSFLIIMMGFTIAGAVKFYFVIFILLIFSVLIIDFIRPETKSIELRLFKDVFQIKNLIYLPLLFLVVLVLSTVDQLGTNFTGDPISHLGIIRKVVENQPITIDNLSYVKNQFHIAYSIPVWHVFLGLLSQIIHTNIFVFYREIPTVLTLLVFLVWYWFFLKILPNRNVAVLTLFLFILYLFQNNGYIYTRLAVPDTLNSFILMPLSFALAIKYIFNKESNYKHLIILSLMLFFMGLIHWTQYFYYLLGMGLFAILYAIFKYRENDFWPVFRKILLSIFANMVLIGPLLIYLKVIIGQNMADFSGVQKGSNNDRFYKFPPYSQLGFVLFPLLGIFIRKYRRLIFVLAAFLAGPLVFNITGVYPLLRQYLSHVFVNRLYGALGQWPYIILALVLVFLLVLIDRLISKISLSRKYLRYAIDILLGMFFVWMIWVQHQTERIEDWYKIVFSDTTHNWLNASYYWLIPAVAAVALLIFFVQKYYRSVLDFCQLQEYKNHSTMLILTLIIVFFLAMPAYNRFSEYPEKEFQNWHFFRQATDPTQDIINPEKFGGWETIDFIKANIPPKSVFDTNTRADYSLPTLADIYIASYAFEGDPTLIYKDLYSATIPIENKLAMLQEGDIDYLVYQYRPEDKDRPPLDLYPQYFTKIYDSSAAIYQVNKRQVQLDLMD